MLGLILPVVSLLFCSLVEFIFQQAERFSKSAYEKAVGMKYRWAEGDAADLLGEIYSVRGDKAKGRKWLKKAVGCRKEILDPKVKETERKLNKIKD